MSTTLQSKSMNDVLASLPPERRAQVEELAGELCENKDLRKAVEILEKSQSLNQSLDDAKFVGELGWLTTLAWAIAVIAI